MRVIEPGHKYELEYFVDEKDLIRSHGHDTIQFIHKTPYPDHPEKLMKVMDGTTNEEVLLMLIDRMRFLNASLPSRQSSIALTKLEEALMWLENRTAERKNRNVEGTHKP